MYCKLRYLEQLSFLQNAPCGQRLAACPPSKKNARRYARFVRPLLLSLLSTSSRSYHTLPKVRANNKIVLLHLQKDFPGGKATLFSSSSREESPPHKNHNKQPQPPNRTILLKQQLPINPNRRLPILLTILPQPRTDLTHPLQTISSIQQILDILRHDLGYIAELVVQLIEVLRCAGVGVGAFGTVDEGVEFHEGVGTEGGREKGVRRIGGTEFGGEVGEVGEG